MINIIKKVFKSWREITGWVIIFVFGYIYLFKINEWGLLAGREMAFWFLVIITASILIWLRVNKK